jgi:hypothetical protein
MATFGRYLGTAALLAALSACTTASPPGDASSAPPTGSPGFRSVGGTWSVTLTVTGGSQVPVGTKLHGTMTLDAPADSNALDGALTLASGITGSIQGSQAGNGFVMTTAETAPCHSGSFDTPDGRANAAYTQLNATFKGRDCNGKLEATLAAVRQGP